MTKQKSTKRALLMSGLALIACVSMLIGSTFAWFTDSVTSGSNIIKSGTLDVEMYWAEGSQAVPTADAGWTDASTGAIFNYAQWEPGYLQARHVKIANVGSLALKYQLRVVANGTVSKLSDVIDVYYFDNATQLTRETAITGTKLGTLTEVLSTDKNLSNTVCGNLLANEEKTVTIAFKMQESAGNEYQNLSVGTDFSVELIAVQHTYEKDSFDENYDKDALSAAVPAAFVRELENKNISATLGIGGAAEAFTLDTAYQFQPTQSYEELLKSEYKYYIADFIVSADNDVPANSIVLAGYYDAWCQYNNNNWVALVNDGLVVNAGQEIGLVEALGAAVHYKDICQYGNDGIGFLCGAADLTGENTGTTLTVKLCLFETTADPNGSSTSYEKVVGAEPIVIGEFKYTFGGEYETLEDNTVLFNSDEGDVVLYDVSNVTATDYTIPESVTELGNAVFSKNTGITTVTIPADVTDFGATGVSATGASGGAFKDSGVTTIVLEEGMTEIPAAAFNGAKKLTSVNIPASVHTIGVNAFRSTALTDLTVPATVTTIGYGAFRDMLSLTTVTFEGSHVDIPDYAFRGCAGLRTVYINAETATVGTNMAFANESSNNPGTNNITFHVKNETVGDLVKASMGVGSTVYIYIDGNLYASIV